MRIEEPRMRSWSNGRVEVEETAVRSILAPMDRYGSIRGKEYSLNPYVGCVMGCSFCYVMKYPFAEEHPRAWGTWVRPKINAPHILRKSKAKIWNKDVSMSSATDPYQYLEREYRLSRKCLEVLLECKLNRMTIHTRSHLVLDDLPLMKEFGSLMRVGFSIPTDDDRVRKRFEPNAPTIEPRLKTMRKLREAGFKVSAAIAPVIHCNPKRLAHLLKDTADRAYIGRMMYDEKTELGKSDKAARYVRSEAYERMIDELAENLKAVGLKDDWRGDRPNRVKREMQSEI